jgi:hypothetical protein
VWSGEPTAISTIDLVWAKLVTDTSKEKIKKKFFILIWFACLTERMVKGFKKGCIGGFFC